MRETINSILQWHMETFPDVTLEQQRAKFEEEWKEFLYAFEYEQDEIEESTSEELSDAFIAAVRLLDMDFCRGMEALNKVRDARLFIYEIGIDDFHEAVDKKMGINRARDWKNNRHI